MKPPKSIVADLLKVVLGGLVTLLLIPGHAFISSLFTQSIFYSCSNPTIIDRTRGEKIEKGKNVTVEVSQFLLHVKIENKGFTSEEDIVVFFRGVPKGALSMISSNPPASKVVTRPSRIPELQTKEVTFPKLAGGRSVDIVLSVVDAADGSGVLIPQLRKHGSITIYGATTDTSCYSPIKRTT